MSGAPGVGALQMPAVVGNVTLLGSNRTVDIMPPYSSFTWTTVTPITPQDLYEAVINISAPSVTYFTRTAPLRGPAAVQQRAEGQETLWPIPTMATQVNFNFAAVLEPPCESNSEAIDPGNASSSQEPSPGQPL